jgi:hypothetical protein
MNNSVTGFLITDEKPKLEVLEVGVEGEIRHRLFIGIRSHSLQARVGTSYSVYVTIFRCSCFVLLHTLLHFLWEAIHC